MSIDRTLKPLTGIEPVTPSLPWKCSTTELQGQLTLRSIFESKSGRRGSNPRPSAWKADALPLSYSRIAIRYVSHTDREVRVGKWWGKDSNLRRLSRQIYSLVPLTARVPHLSKLFRTLCELLKAGDGTRTRNLLFTKQLLCQLSYTSIPATITGNGATEIISDRVRVNIEKRKRCVFPQKSHAELDAGPGKGLPKRLKSALGQLLIDDLKLLKHL